METAGPLLECSSMTKLQKLAALCVILGADSASELLKNLDEDELETVSAEMARLTFISQEMQAEILREFTDVAVAASAAVLGGPGYAKKALEKSVGPSRASDIIRRVAPAAAPAPDMEPLLEMDPLRALQFAQTRAAANHCPARQLFVPGKKLATPRPPAARRPRRSGGTAGHDGAGSG